VYGVKVPGWEGKAGMAALKVGQNFDIEAFAAHLQKNLPAYAQPVFLRFRKSIAATSTFKQRKIELQEEGFNPDKITEPLYARDDSGNYAALTPELYDDICAHKVQL
ncbi:MAG: hypothetical protein V3S07_06700, partial [Micropepsaceae bacterium]